MWIKRKLLGHVLRNEELGGEAGGGGTGGTGGGDSSGSGSGEPSSVVSRGLEEITSDLFSSGDLGDGKDSDAGAGKPNPNAAPSPSPASAPTPSPAPAPAPAQTDAEKAAAAAAQTPAPPPGQTDPNALPKTWKQSPELQAKWAATDPLIKEEVARREEAMFKGLGAYKADAEVGRLAKSWVEPHLPLLRAHNVDPGKLIPDLLNYHKTLALGSPAARLQTLRSIAESYGITADELAAEAPYEPPEVKALRLENQRLNSLHTQTVEQQRAATTQMLERQLDTFVKDPANEHIQIVMADMLPFVKDGMELKDAYERALWVNPVTRAKLQAAEAEKAAATRAKEEAARVAAVRKATAANVNTSSRSGTATGTVGSMEDTLNETLASIKARN